MMRRLLSWLLGVPLRCPHGCCPLPAKVVIAIVLDAVGGWMFVAWALVSAAIGLWLGVLLERRLFG